MQLRLTIMLQELPNHWRSVMAYLQTSQYFLQKQQEYTKIYKWEPYNQFNLKTDDDDDDENANFQNNCI